MDEQDIFIKWLEKYIDERLEKLVDTVLKPVIDAAVTDGIEKSIKNISRKKTACTFITNKRNLINTFGYESYEHMHMPYLVDLLKGTNDCDSILQRIIADLYFNPEVKQNHNVYIPLQTYKCINTYVRGSWQSRILDSTIEKMILRANDVLQHYLVGSNDVDEAFFRQELGKKKYDILKEFTNRIDNIERFPELKHKWIRETEHTILTRQHFVHNDLVNGEQVPLELQK